MTKMTVLERLMALSLLPKEGDFVTLKIVRNLRETLSFSEEELKALELKLVPEKGYEWKIEGVPAEILNKEITLGPKAASLIADSIEALNNDKKLTEQLFSLYEKFCVTEQEKPNA